MPSDDRFGVCYVATGGQFVKEANRSAERIDTVSPDTPCSIVTDEASTDIVSDVFDELLTLSEPSFSWTDKPRGLALSPYKRTLYLDSDTWVVSADGLADLNTVLDRVPVAAAHGIIRSIAAKYESRPISPSPAPPTYPWFNTGVIAFRRDDANELLTEWQQRHETYEQELAGINDQEAFRDAAYVSDACIHTIPPEYNYRVGNGFQYLNGPVRILHGRLNEQSYRDIANTVNDERALRDDGRSYRIVRVGEDAIARRVGLTKTEYRLSRLFLSLSRRGLGTTASRVLDWIRGGRFH
ncbi:glycosyltransferase family protein [Halopenitus persicus]|nr:hypothetical protein [Halopenitus persicus]